MPGGGSHAGAEKRYPTSTAASRQRGKWGSWCGLRRAKVVIVTGSVGFSTGAETCTSSATAEPVSRKRRTVDLGETKAGSWGCVG